jgi:putative FmdB family regulatory protein
VTVNHLQSASGVRIPHLPQIGGVMPIYEYKCKECDTKVTLVKSADERDNDLPQCKACNSDIRRVYSSVGVSFTGSGFYSTDK